MITPEWAADYYNADPCETTGTIFDGISARLSYLRDVLETAAESTSPTAIMYGVKDDLEDLMAYINAWRTWKSKHRQEAQS